MTKRDELLQAIEGLSDETIVKVIAFAREAADREALHGYPPAVANAPYDDEPWTAEDEAAIAKAEADLAAGNVSPGEDVFRRLLG